MRIRLRCSAGLDNTDWKEVPSSGRIIFERTEFTRRDLPTDFIVELQSSYPSTEEDRERRTRLMEAPETA